MQQSTHDMSAWADAAYCHVEPPNPAGWSEVNKGLYSVLGGIIFIVGLSALIANTSLLPMVIGAAHFGSSGSFGASVVILIVVVLLYLFAYGLILGNLWRCLRNAPEQNGAKWWMFAYILCSIGFPVLVLTSLLAGFREAPGRTPSNTRNLLPAASANYTPMWRRL